MAWYSWWTGRIGSVSNPSKLRSSSNDGRPKVALVIGITGIVGTSLAKILPRSDAPGGPWKVYGVARRPQPRWFADSPIEYIECDVLDESDTAEKISPLKDVTHLFWVVWVSRSSEEKNCLDNGKMFRNVLDALLPNAPRLQHICLQTGGKHYLGPHSIAGKALAHEPPFREEMPRLPVVNFYYTLEDILFDTVKKKEGLTWSVHRPNVIFGFSPWSLMNLLGSLAAYAAICKHEGLPFRYPGNKVTWEQFGDVSDAELIAEQEVWASVDPSGKNHAFNVTNGDVFKYKRVWSLLAGRFGLEVPPYNGQPISLKEMMKDKESVWEEIVAEHDLIPTKLEDVGNWWFVDLVLNTPFTSVSSMNKSKESGFLGFRNTEASVLHWIDKMRRKKIVP